MSLIDGDPELHSHDTRNVCTSEELREISKVMTTIIRNYQPNPVL